MSVTIPVNPAVDQLWVNNGTIYRFTTKGTWRVVGREEDLLRYGNGWSTIFGEGPVVHGLAVTPTPNTLAVDMAPGAIFASAALERSGGTIHSVMKQAVLLDKVNFQLAVATTTDYEQIYLIQVQYQDAPNDLGAPNTPNNKTRLGKLAYGIKQGIAATVGAAQSPTPDTGWVGIYSVKVSPGTSSIATANITRYPGAPYVVSKLPALPSHAQDGRWNYAIDLGTSENALIVNLNPAPAVLVEGMHIRVKTRVANTGPATIKVNGITVPLLRKSGTPIAANEWAANEIIELTYYAGSFRASTYSSKEVTLVYNQEVIITTRLTRTVYGPGADFADLNAAFLWLSQFRISTSGSVSFQLGSGVGNNKFVHTQAAVFNHPDGIRVEIVGAARSAALPADFAVTGFSQSQRQNDNANLLTLLRGVFNTELNFVNNNGLVINSQLGNIADILITGVRGSAPETYGLIVANSANIKNVWAGGFNSHGIVFTGGQSSTSGVCGGFDNAGSGISTQAGGYVSLYGTVWGLSNGDSGIVTQLGGNLNTSTDPQYNAKGVAKGNANIGFYANSQSFFAGQTTGWRSSYNGAYGAFASQGSSLILPNGCDCSNNPSGGFGTNINSYMNVSNSTGNNNGGWGYQASDMSEIIRTAGTCTGTSGSVTPALGVIGNNNSIVV